MISGSDKITRFDIKALGLSDYTIKQILKNLESNDLGEFSTSEVAASIEARLQSAKIQRKTKASLQNALDRLNGKSNTIDFLQRLSPEARLNALYASRRELEAQEEALKQEISLLWTQAKKFLDDNGMDALTTDELIIAMAAITYAAALRIKKQ